MKTSKYYVVWKGRKTGIYNRWEDCSAQVSGFQGAEYKSFSTRAAAEEAWRGEYKQYQGKNNFQQGFLSVPPPVLESYCVDAACSGNPGWLEYRCIQTMSGRQIFHCGPIPNGTNNIGEFLAVVHALALFQEKGIPAPIYSDSENALAWVRGKKCKTTLPVNPETSQVYDLIRRAEQWLQANSYTNEILKWDTQAWGEIPADFGRK